MFIYRMKKSIKHTLKVNHCFKIHAYLNKSFIEILKFHSIWNSTTLTRQMCNSKSVSHNLLKTNEVPHFKQVIKKYLDVRSSQFKPFRGRGVLKVSNLLKFESSQSVVKISWKTVEKIRSSAFFSNVQRSI